MNWAWMPVPRITRGVSVKNMDDDFYYLKNPDWCFTGESSGFLPLVVCEFCGQRVGDSPSLPLLPEAPFREWLMPDGIFPFREITWREFLKIQEIGRPFLSPGAELVPTTSIGSFSIKHLGHPHAVLKDIEFAEPGGFLFSQDLLGKLHERGITLPNQKLVLTDRRERPKDFGLIHVEAFRTFHPKTIRDDGLKSCEACGSVWFENPFHKPPDFFLLERGRKEEVGDFFRIVANTARVYLSERACAILTELDPIGFCAVKIGRWAD